MPAPRGTVTIVDDNEQDIDAVALGRHIYYKARCGDSFKVKFVLQRCYRDKKPYVVACNIDGSSVGYEYTLLNSMSSTIVFDGFCDGMSGLRRKCTFGSVNMVGPAATSDTNVGKVDILVYECQKYTRDIVPVQCSLICNLGKKQLVEDPNKLSYEMQSLQTVAGVSFQSTPLSTDKELVYERLGLPLLTKTVLL